MRDCYCCLLGSSEASTNCRILDNWLKVCYIIRYPLLSFGKKQPALKIKSRRIFSRQASPEVCHAVSDKLGGQRGCLAIAQN